MENEAVLQSALPTVNLSGNTVAFEGKRWSYYMGISALLILLWCIKLRRQSMDPAVGFPHYKGSKFKWIFSAESLVKDSYKQFRDTIYQIRATEGVQVVVPPKVVAELKTLPDNVLSTSEALVDAIQSKYTHFLPEEDVSELLTLLVRTRLTQRLTKLVPILREELQHIMATEFPDCDDWTSFKISPFALRIVARISGRAFVGEDLCRNETWMNSNIKYPVDMFMACIKLQCFPSWMRPLAQYLVWDLAKLKWHRSTAENLIRPALEERLRLQNMPESDDKPDDLLSWFVEGLDEARKGDTALHAHLQLLISAASIHSTNNLLTECFYDLAVRPELQDELREESWQILEADGGWSKKESLAKLKKLDSFIKEVQRTSGNITSFIRMTMEPITLADGTSFPARTKLLAASAGIAEDERYFDRATTFDPMRFYNSRKESDEANNRWQFTSINDTNLNFGAGRHACPGRFFAGNVLKMVLAHFILHYDLRLRSGEERPKAMGLVMTKAANQTAELEFRKRTSMH